MDSNGDKRDKPAVSPLHKCEAMGLDAIGVGLKWPQAGRPSRIALARP
jgi:hypothetical protein